MYDKINHWSNFVLHYSVFRFTYINITKAAIQIHLKEDNTINEMSSFWQMANSSQIVSTIWIIEMVMTIIFTSVTNWPTNTVTKNTNSRLTKKLAITKMLQQDDISSSSDRTFTTTLITVWLFLDKSRILYSFFQCSPSTTFMNYAMHDILQNQTASFVSDKKWNESWYLRFKR